MAGSSYGTLFKISTFGESHGEAIGGVIDGVPANFLCSGIFAEERILERCTLISFFN